ncbi:hypothetical protein TBR22_A02910 [Luteitalea sp. TBR-22]|uniref:DUF5777 family beta-barrel protein n=1 Tax=Luteitalea sp. TBR-22 TaxID=2802971 RepID=UPI001AF9B96B|nr:DUF5777 family beta-barrel protein [Luteitalea sp. TBR-22]BCS31091.1 hypothetical protein TBR22_A02910 [Luteitalea sp. TBR-22]
MKTTFLATALTLIAIGALPAAAQETRTEPASTPKPAVEGAAAPATPTTPATAEDPKPAADATAVVQDDEDDPDLDVNPAQPDFTIVGLPTSLRMPRGKFAFRVTHRFGRPLDDGNFGDLAADLFGLDAGGLIGLEVRYGLLKGTQVGVLRTSDRTIQFFAQQQIAPQEKFGVGLALNLTADGTNNFQDSYSPGIGLIVSREIGKRAAVYVEPTWVNNTNTLPSELVDDNSSFLLGIGGRIRMTRRSYLVAEVAPRVSGYDEGRTHGAIGLEMRAGNHAFQLNFSNGLQTTMGQIARGGTPDDWFIGFNISRKFW